MEKVGVAVVGVGLLGARHARIYGELRNCELVAVCDISAQRAQEIAVKYGARKWYVDCEEMLRDDEIDFEAVDVCTPDFAHREPVVAALEAGKHVLVEKPLATSLSDAHKMVDAAERANRKLMVKYASRWRPEDIEVKRAVESGEIGEPLWGRSYCIDTIYVPTEKLSWARSSSPAWFLSCYDLDALGWYLNSSVVEVCAHGTRRVLRNRGIDTWDGLQALLAFDSGFSFTMESSWIRPNSFPKATEAYLEIVGSEGVVWKDERYLTPHIYAQRGAKMATVGSYEVNGEIQGAVRWAIEHFLDCVIDDKDPWTPGSEGLKHVEVLEAIHRSAEHNEVVRLPLPL